MPTRPRPGPVEPDTDPFATQVAPARGAPAKPAPSPEPGTPSCPNPLISEADPLLALVPQLRSTAQVADLARLRAQIAALLQQFDERSRQRGVAAPQCQKAHFVLCALIDEVVETMPWGAGGRWERLNPLQAGQAGRSSDGALRSLAQMAQDPGGNRDLRELIYVALALGFDARPRAGAAASAESEQIRARVAALLKPDPGATAQRLSVRWQPAVGRGSALASWLPLWVGSLVAAGLLAALYFGLALALAAQSDKVFAQIAALRLPASSMARGPIAASTARLQPLLGTAAGQGPQVRDEIDRSVVTLRDDALFDPGTANLSRAGIETLRPVAAALQQAAGRILVVGHTDTLSERSTRYPSNWELSVERARAVRDGLRAFGLADSRLRYDGRADTEPLASADAKQVATHNGRVEIVLLAGR